MSDDDYIPTPTESDPISDVNPDEMDQLMADLDDMDDSLFKSDKKGSTSKTVSPDKKSGKRVSFDKAIESSKDKDDWDSVDADDLLNFDDDKKSKQKEKVSKPSLESGTTGKREFDSKKNSDLKSPRKVSPKANKSKLYSDLFDDSKSENKSSQPSSNVTPEKAKPKSRSDVIFDDDESDPLNMTSKAKRSDTDFMDSLFGESSSITKAKSKSSSDFVLPDKYKKPDEERGSRPSSISPGKKGGRSDYSDPLDDLFGGGSSRPRRGVSGQRTNKPFEIDDDDILGGGRTRKSASQGTENSKANEGKRASKQDDWLFGSPKGTPLKQEERKSSPVSPTSRQKATPSASPQKAASASPQKKDDWLNQLLSNKSSPSVQAPVKHQSEAPTTKSPAKQKQSPKDHLSPDYSPPKQTSMVSHTPLLNSMTIIQTQMAEQQAKIQAEAAAMASQLQMQQLEMEAQMMQQFQLQMQEQQQKLAQIMLQPKQMTLPSFSTSNVQTLAEDDESIKQLKINLHRAETEVGRLQVELSMLRDQHEKEIEIITDSQKKKENYHEDFWRKKEESVNQERDSLIERYEMTIRDLQKEKTSLAASYEAKLSQVQTEMTNALQQSKEMYANIIERMKKEHRNAVERLTELKEIELKAALTAAGRVVEVEHVVDRLEANTADISQIKTAVRERHESALELVKRSLQVKEKQLKDMEANLETVKAETESERNRLTVLVNRLESSLANQGTETESQKWALAQEKMKLDVERTALIDEKRHFKVTVENERKQLAYAKEAILREQKEMMQNIARQKARIHDNEYRQVKSSLTFPAEMEILQLKEEKKMLEEKISSLRIQQEEMTEEYQDLEEKRLKLDEDLAKNEASKEMIAQKNEDLEARSRDLDRKEEKLEEARKDLQKKFSEITQATHDLHLQQEVLARERARLEMEQEENMKSMSKRLCPSCFSKLFSKVPNLPVSFGRILEHGSESRGRSHKELSRKSFDPSSVLSRLKAAREEENRIRQKKLDLQSALGRKLS